MKVVVIGSLAARRRHHARARPLHMNLLGALLIVVLRLPLRHGLVAAHRRNRLLVESDLRHDRRHAAAHLPGVPGRRLDRAAIYYVTALSVGGIVCIAVVERRHHVAGSEDRLPRRRDAAPPADRHPDRRARLGAGARTDPAQAERRRDGLCAGVAKQVVEAADGSRTLRDVETCPATMRVEPSTLKERETYAGTELSRLAQAADRAGVRRASTSSIERQRRLSRRSGHQRHAPHDAGWQRRCASSTRRRPR